MAILEIPKLRKCFEIYSKYAVSSEKFIVNKTKINIGDSFLHVSYPLIEYIDFGYTTTFSPYVFRTYSINLITKMPRIDNREIFNDLIRVNPCSYQGSSGGPLISIECNSDDFNIIGISHGSTRDPQFNQEVMSVFTPMYYFFDIINY